MALEAGNIMKKGKICEDKDRISALHDDLLVRILSLIPTKDAVTTMLLSKRWLYVWTMLPKLKYTDKREHEKSVWDFLDKSLQSHRAPSLETLHIMLRKQCPVDVDVGKWVAYAVERYVQQLELQICSPPTPEHLTSLPESFYTCKTLVTLTLSHNILIDVPSRVCFPSLLSINLFFVVYKDQDSQVRLLSSCPVLRELFVFRKEGDNVTRFSVRVTSLQSLIYANWPSESDAGGSGTSLVIDTPGLNDVSIYDLSTDSWLIENMPRLDAASVIIGSHLNEKLLRSFSSVKFLKLRNVNPLFTAINFSRLIELEVSPDDLEAIMLMLRNSPKLKVLMVKDIAFVDDDMDIFNFFPLSWKQPNSVPGCLSHLEIFEWKEFRGRIDEKQLVKYILANTKSLKTVGISPRSSYNLEKKEKITKELESMYRVSTSSQLLFSAQIRWRNKK